MAASTTERIALLLCIGIAVVGGVAYFVSTSNAEFERSQRPQYEWKSSPSDTFGIPPLGSRTITWPNLPKAKARFTFTSTVPIDFSVSNSSCADRRMMLSSTVECELEGGETIATLKDSRTPGQEAARLGFGLYTRDRNVMNEITPATATFSAAFFVCVRNCIFAPVTSRRQTLAPLDQPTPEPDCYNGERFENGHVVHCGARAINDASK